MAWRLWKKHGVQPEGRLEAVLVAVLLGGYWVLQLVFCLCAGSAAHLHLGFGLVFSAAQQYAQSGVLPGDYFSQFHNNAPMYPVLVVFFKVLGALGVQDVMPAALVCNTLCVNGALLLLYQVLRRLYGAKSALFGLARGVFVPSVPVVRPHCVYRHSYIAFSHRCAGAVAQCTGARAGAGRCCAARVRAFGSGGRRGWKMAGCMVLSFAALYRCAEFLPHCTAPTLPAYDREKAILAALR